MILKPDTLPEGAPCAIGSAIVAALRADPVLAGSRVLDNPLRASDLADGDRIVFFEDQTDKPIASNKRSYGFTVGVISRAGDARKKAHADFRAAKRVIGASMPEINKLVTVDARGLVEGEVRFRLENIDVGGGLVLGMFTLDYRDPG